MADGVVEQAAHYAAKLAAFERFDGENPQVWRHFCRFTQELIAAGRQHYGAKAVIERVRWHMAVTTMSEDNFRINNNHFPFYARKWLAVHTTPPEFFRVRVQRGCCPFKNRKTGVQCVLPYGHTTRHRGFLRED